MNIDNRFRSYWRRQVSSGYDELLATNLRQHDDDELMATVFENIVI